MYATVALSTSGKSIPVNLDFDSSFKKSKTSLNNRISIVKQELESIDLDGFNSNVIDQIIIVKVGINDSHTRYTKQI